MLFILFQCILEEFILSVLNLCYRIIVVGFFCNYRNFVCLILESFYVYDLNIVVIYSVFINQNICILFLNEKKRNMLFVIVDKD